MKNIKKFNELNTYIKLTNKERINAISELEKRGWLLEETVRLNIHSVPTWYNDVVDVFMS